MGLTASLMAHAIFTPANSTTEGDTGTINPSLNTYMAGLGTIRISAKQTHDLIK
jgi:hypothetical protein